MAGFVGLSFICLTFVELGENILALLQDSKWIGQVLF